MNMKKALCIVLTAVLILCLVPAALANGISDALNGIHDFKFFVRKEGIGLGDCPIYTGPGEYYLRCANGKAVCNTDYAVDVGGYEKGTRWLMVRYETNNGGVRVGFIPPSYTHGYKDKNIDDLSFIYVPVTAQQTLSVTDNPKDNSGGVNTAFTTLYPGDNFMILGKYNYYGNWWYVECEVNGQPARGFIDRDIAIIPGFDPVPEGSIGTVRITQNELKVRKKAGTEYDVVTMLYSGIAYPVYNTATASNGRTWYYVFVDGYWGWVSSASCTFTSR